MRCWLPLVVLAVAALRQHPTSAVDVHLVGGEKPAVIALDVTIDGRPVPEVWDETFAKLLAFHDCNGDGFLDKTESARLPSPFSLRQVLWGQFVSATGAPDWVKLDTNADGKVTADELAGWYRKAGLGDVLVGVGKPAATDRLTDALLKALDTNKDGTVTEAEGKAAADVLRKLDANDDDLIGPAELVEKLSYPGATGSVLLAPGSREALPLVVSPDRKETPSYAWRVNLGTRKDGTPLLEAAGQQPPADGRLSLTHGLIRLELRADEGKLAEQTATGLKRLRALFAECDADADGTLNDKELTAGKAGLFKQILAPGDRDGDGKLTETELSAWLTLQEQVAKGHVLLTVLDHGSGLFELLDADRDAALSVRELRSVWDRIKAVGCATEGRFDRAKLPRQFIAAVSRGHPATTICAPVRGGPDWFRAMDRNGDGDVSRREWLGEADQFKHLDSDGDGLVGPAEAAKVKAP